MRLEKLQRLNNSFKFNNTENLLYFRNTAGFLIDKL